MMHVQCRSIQEYVCETGVGIQVIVTPLHPTALQCAVYKSHTYFQVVFSNISKLYRAVDKTFDLGGAIVNPASWQLP